MKKRLLKLVNYVRENWIYISIPLLTFTILLVPFYGLQPCYDGIGEYIKAQEYYREGILKYLQNASLHPPWKMAILSQFFNVFGINLRTLTVVGYLHGVLGIISLYVLTRKLFNSRVGLLASMFLALCPIYLANTPHFVIDYLVTVYTLTALAFYAHRKYFFFALFSSIAVLSKDTGLILPASVLIVEFIHHWEEFLKFFSLRTYYRLTPLLLPFISYMWWYNLVRSNGYQLWNENIFAETKSKGAFITILTNLLKWNFFHEWATKHRLMLFYLNFNWVMWGIAVAGLLWFIVKKKPRFVLQFLFRPDQRARTLLVIFLFCIAYFFTVLTFQTFTAPRYDLPILMFVYIAVAYTIIHALPKIPLVVLIFFAVLLIVRLFRSYDPVSTILWETKPVSGQRIYAFDHVVDGNDAIIYNLQYLLLVRNRVMTIRSLSSASGGGNPDSAPVCTLTY